MYRERLEELLDRIFAEPLQKSSTANQIEFLEKMRDLRYKNQQEYKAYMLRYAEVMNSKLM